MLRPHPEESALTIQLSRRTVAIVLAALLALSAVATTSLVLTLTGRAEANHRFNDVGNTNFFHDSTAWLKDNGIADGFPNGAFFPKANITRGQASYWFSNFNDYLDVPTILRTDSTAGGDLSGTYPNPDVAADAITGAEVAPRSLGLADVAVAHSGQTGLNLPSIPAHSCTDTAVSVAAVLNTDVVVVTPPPTLPAGVIVGTRKSSNNGQIVIRACNVGASASADPDNSAMSYAVFR